jgi:hypothetical protein
MRTAVAWIEETALYLENLAVDGVSQIRFVTPKNSIAFRNCILQNQVEDSLTQAISDQAIGL